MPKQYAIVESVTVDQTLLAAKDPVGLEIVALRAWSSTDLPPAQTGGDGAGARAELSGSAFMFEPNWLGTATEVASLGGGLPMIGFAGALDGVFAALSGHAADGSASGLSDAIPVWSLSHDDFSNL